ncbi:hypothetical protein [Paraburkholderia youngii]|uniref:hypothetical protein n=1 Tax=Paraburkholderia youngii TaxID=2782701 RepID=UPI003D21FD4E
MPQVIARDEALLAEVGQRLCIGNARSGALYAPTVPSCTSFSASATRRATSRIPFMYEDRIRCAALRLQALPLSHMNALAIHADQPPPGFPHFGEQPILTKVTGHTNVVVGDQTVALATSEQRYAGGYISECKQYVKSYEHQVVAESSFSGSSNVPTDETTIKLGNHCDRPEKG